MLVAVFSGIAIALAACSSQSSSLPNITTQAAPQAARHATARPNDAVNPSDDGACNDGATVCTNCDNGCSNGGDVGPVETDTGTVAGSSYNNPTTQCGSRACPTLPPTQVESPIAVTQHPPQQGDTCKQTSDSDSLAIGSTVGIANVGGQAQARSVVDINTLYAYASSKVLNNQVILVGVQSMGWVYVDNGGNYWYQADPATQWSTNVSVGITLGSLLSASVGITPPTGTTPVPLGSSPGKLGSSVQASPCFNPGDHMYAGMALG